MKPPVLDVTSTAARRAVRPQNRMLVGLRGDHRLLHARQKLLRLEQRQPQMRDIAKVAGRHDLHDVDTRSGAISLRFDHPQNPPHPRSPGRQWPNRSYRLRPHPPNFWTLPDVGRPSITWGDSCGVAKRATGPSLSGFVIRVEGPVHDGGSDLEHQMRSSRRPRHLLVGAHPPVQQPLHRTLGGRRRYRLVGSPGGGIIDDQTGLPGYVSLEATKQAYHLTRGRSVRRCRFGRGIEYHQGVSDVIERPLYLPVPEAPTDMLDGVGQAGSFRAVLRRGVRPALGGLSDMLSIGLSIRAVANSPLGAQFVGINTDKAIIATFAIGSMLGAAAGIL